MRPTSISTSSTRSATRQTLDKHFEHTILKIGYSYNGPTEIGGLVLDPKYRRVPERLGTFLSYVRFLFIKMHRELVPRRGARRAPAAAREGRHLAPLGRARPPLHRPDATPRPTSSRSKNKEFIRGLFPEGTIYASLLPKHAQDVIGKVGAQTRGVEKMLRRIGFRYAERVDPFDGGPHFTAMTDEVSLVVSSRRFRIAELIEDDTLASLPPEKRKRAVVAVEPARPAVLPRDARGLRGASRRHVRARRRRSSCARPRRGRGRVGPAAGVREAPARSVRLGNVGLPFFPGWPEDPPKVPLRKRVVNALGVVRRTREGVLENADRARAAAE